jgi:hypothetical protein
MLTREVATSISLHMKLVPSPKPPDCLLDPSDFTAEATNVAIGVTKPASLMLSFSEED